MKQFIPILLLFIFACEKNQEQNVHTDLRSYRLGVIGAFSEVVDIGIKKMALSSPMTPIEMDALIEEAKTIAERNNCQLYRETDFLVTDLFPASVTDGKHVLVIYQNETLDQYKALKKEKKAFIETDSYDEKNRHAIALKMAELLSYPDSRIEKLLKGAVNIE